MGIEAVAIVPANAAFDAFGLALLKGIAEAGPAFRPRAVIYVAPPFHHTRFDGKQIVVHKRGGEVEDDARFIHEE